MGLLAAADDVGWNAGKLDLRILALEGEFVNKKRDSVNLLATCTQIYTSD